MDELDRHIGGQRRLAETTGKMRWPDRGVYFFFEPGERRTSDKGGSRIVRVGTHALKTGARATLWDRLRRHRGTINPPGGNHHGSIFRTLVGDALMAQAPELAVPTWGKKSSAPRHVREAERLLERLVSQRIGEMTVLFLPVEDAPGPQSARASIERNTIALLSGYIEAPVDAPSARWLGRHSTRERVRQSGLWNNNHVDENPDPRFLDVFHDFVRKAAFHRDHRHLLPPA